MFKCGLYGEHNLQNVAGVLALLIELGIDPKKLFNGLQTFSGVKRRQEIRGVVNNITLIDDFAHHPTAVQETIKAIKTKYPTSKVWSVFEPRSNTSRKNTFQHEFSASFEGSDIAIIAPPYKLEKLSKTECLNVDQLIDEIKKNGIEAFTFKNTDEIVKFIAKNARPGDVILVMSNGGFDNIHEKLLTALKG